MSVYTRDAVLEMPAGNRPIRAILATSDLQPDGIALRMAGADLRRYQRNPVLLWEHRLDELPLGRVDNIRVGLFEMAGELRFAQSDPHARRVEGLVREKVLNAVSVRFEPHRVENNGDCPAWELIETSVVTVPMDPRAEVISRAAPSGSYPVAQAMVDASAYRSVLDAFGSLDVDQRAADRLLASFDLPVTRARFNAAFSQVLAEIASGR